MSISAGLSLTKNESLKELLIQVQEKARLHEWQSAFKLCDAQLARFQPELQADEQSTLRELAAKCKFKAAFQAGDRAEFEAHMRVVEEYYRKAADNFDTVGKSGLAKRARSRMLFATYWLSIDPKDRRSIIRTCVEMSGQAALEFQSQADWGPLADTHLDLLNFFREGCNLQTESELLKRDFEDAARIGRLAIGEYEAKQDLNALLESLSLTLWLLAVEAQAVLAPPEFQKLATETRHLEARIIQVSKEIGTPYSTCLAKYAAGHVAYDLDGNPADALELYKQSASLAVLLKDSLLLGRSLRSVAQIEYWLGFSEEDSERRRQLLEEGFDFGTRAINALQIPFATTDLAVAYASCADCQIELAGVGETEPVRKKERFRRAIEDASRGVAYESGTWGWTMAAHSHAKAMYSLSHFEEPIRRVELLKDALSTRELILEVTDRLFPQFWNPVVVRHSLALLKADLASLEKDQSARFDLLRQATRDLQESLELGSKWATNLGFQRRLAQFSETYGDVLFQLLKLKDANEHGEKAVKAYEQAVEYLTKSNRTAAIGPIKWKIARVYDRLGNPAKASDSFKDAAEMYRKAGREIPGSASTFQELVVYMDSWSNIELARLNHSKGEYQAASEGYSKTASALRATQTWGYLSQLCSARALLENGELLSSEENHAGSMEAFKKAVSEFQAAKAEIENKLGAGTDADAQDLGEWMKIAIQREAYCQARIELEQAETNDRKGDKNASAKKYHSAADKFEALSRGIDVESDRAELLTFAQFCEAWSMMKEAEATLSSELYGKAADTFLSARKTTNRESFRLLAFANASICSALEAATKFRASRDMELYSQVKAHLESAADHFHEAGFRKTENWTRGTQRLFDALVYMSQAEMEKDYKKKTEFYHLAEQQLGLAAKLYGDAGFPGKRKEALEHLGRTRIEKDALLAPIQALSQVPTAPGVSLAYLTLPRGQAGGVERFEEACIVGETIVSQRELIADSNFSIEFEVANVGKTAATLVKMEDVVPEGFEYDREGNAFPMEGSFVDLKGRRLEHLKTLQVKAGMKTDGEGEFVLRPRLFYADDVGNYRSFQFQSTTISVLGGVSGKRSSLTGLTAPPKIIIPEGFRFDTERAREVFQRLVVDFLQDYMSRRLFIEKAGWRSLMDLVREMKIPRSAVYGSQGRSGPVLVELERRGLVELRIFPKERGRGGAIKKIRVAYENEIVKRFVEEIVKTSS